MASPATRPLLAAVTAVLVLSSCPACVAHTHRIGLGPTGIGEESQRQYYILFGLLPCNEVDVQRMASDLTSYEIESRYSFLDMLLQPLLLPFTMTSRTVTVRK